MSMAVNIVNGALRQHLNVMSEDLSVEFKLVFIVIVHSDGMAKNLVFGPDTICATYCITYK